MNLNNTRVNEINPAADRRRRLTPQQRDEIAKRKGEPSRALAEEYGVSRRTIQFIQYPERLAENKQRRQERGGWRQYYDKDKHREYTRDHREYKRSLIEENEQ